MTTETKKETPIAAPAFEVEKPSLLVFFATVGVVLAISGATFGTSAVNNMRTGSGKLVNEPREVDTFSKLIASGDVIVKIAKGETESVNISAEDNVMTDVSATVSDGTLTVSHAATGLPFLSARPTKDIVVTVVVKNISSIIANDAVTVTGKNIPSGDIAIEQNSSKNISVNVSAKKLTVVLTGTGSATVSGSAESEKLTNSGTGSINTKEVSTVNVNATVAASGSVLTNSSDTLTANITGSGNIEYKGNPPTVNKKITGSGKLKKL